MATEGASSILGIAIRDVARLQKVAGIVAKHGFGEVLTRMPFAAQLLRGGVVRPGKEAEGTPGERFTRLLAELGPTYIKLGQVLSMRSDLLPDDYIKALTTLQDQAPVIPLADVRRAIEVGLGQKVDELFSQFSEEPLATASIAQTHRARTKDGRDVAVKVQRPRISELMRGDLDLLYLAARGLEASIEDLKLIGPSAIVAEFEKGLLRELNFSAEMGNLVAMQRLLDPSRPVVVPEPIPELSCRTVLTMAYFDGVPVRDLEPESDRAKEVVEHIINTMCKGILVDGFFHGDPHAGNILVSKDGHICFLDLGLVGTLSQEQRDDIVTLVFATILDDAATVARVLLKVGTPTQRVDIGELKTEISRVRSQYVMVRSVSEIDSARFVEDFVHAASRFRVKLATEYTVLAKSVGTIEGLVRRLHPDADVLPIVRPYVEKVFADRWTPTQMVQHALGGATGVASLLRTVPTHVDQILHDLETGNVQVRPVTPKLDQLPDRVHQSATRIAVAIFAAAMSICAAVVVPDSFVHWMAWLKVVLFVTFFASAIAGWFVTWWWHWLGGGRTLRLAPIVNLFRRSRGR